MPMTRNQILLEAQSLSAEDRNALIEDLRQSGEDFTRNNSPKRVDASRPWIGASSALCPVSRSCRKCFNP